MCVWHAFSFCWRVKILVSCVFYFLFCKTNFLLTCTGTVDILILKILISCVLNIPQLMLIFFFLKPPTHLRSILTASARTSHIHMNSEREGERENVVCVHACIPACMQVCLRVKECHMCVFVCVCMHIWWYTCYVCGGTCVRSGICVVCTCLLSCHI